MCEFRSGDVVRFKSWETMEKEFGVDDGEILCRFRFVPDMKELCGMEAVIANISADGMVDFENDPANEIGLYDRVHRYSSYFYHTDMIEPAYCDIKDSDIMEVICDV